MDPIPWLVELLLRTDLRRTFRRICWVGDWPPSLPDGPIIAYCNHTHYYDGHLGWLLFQDRLDRSATLWMAEWQRFPFFGAVGAQPFPRDDAGERAATLRRTARRFHNNPETVLIYYPEGELHASAEGIRSFAPSATRRLGRLYPQATWWPFAIRVTWDGEAHPTAYLAGGPGHAADGKERARLSTLLNSLSPDAGSVRTLMEGRRSQSERWDFSFAAPFFERYL